jgi:N,N'-diacetyllegionaminate synthase
LLDELKIGSLKLASADINNLPFIKYCARKCAEHNANFQMDTGNADIWEIERAVITAEEMGCENIVIHHCPSGYPARLQSINLNTIKTLKLLFPQYAIAFSDHTEGWDMDIAAIAIGADLVEKTITLDRTIRSCEHSFSLNPDMAASFMTAIKNIDIALGSTRRVIPFTEKQKRRTARRSPYLKQNMKAGEIITEDKFELRRPEAGISMIEFESVIGKKLKTDISKDQPLQAEHV